MGKWDDHYTLVKITIHPAVGDGQLNYDTAS